MNNSPSIKQVQATTYAVLPGTEPDLSRPVGRLVVTETKTALREALTETEPEYGFALFGPEGDQIAIVAPGFWPFFLKAVRQVIPLHGEACEKDCATEIGSLVVMPVRSE